MKMKSFRFITKPFSFCHPERSEGSPAEILRRYAAQTDSLVKVLRQILSNGLFIILVSGLCALAHAEPKNTPQSATDKSLETATFAGGCFWCMEPPFDELAGVLSTTSGYTGGQKKDPTYEQVSAGGTGHTEAVQVVFDPTKISYGELLEVFWRNIDPTTLNRQFCDVGSQYRTAIFYHNDDQQRLAETSKKAIEDSGRLTKPIVTEIAPASEFYVAEEYHQDYYKKNPLRYKFYRYNCGRDQALEAIWGDGKVTASP
jgi:peptide-methionine (S)-S-oxide reductase